MTLHTAMANHVVHPDIRYSWQNIIRNFLQQYWPFLLLVVLAVILRSPDYGDPDVSLDEEFYLVVADRMMHGALPYVDIWDRKPIGLFLIYAATRLLGGEGYIQYQVVAALFAGATAGFIWLIARRAASNVGALLAALAYIFWLNIFSGSAGQSPVFYNLFIVAAAYLAFRSNDSTDTRKIAQYGMAATFLCGLAIQVKYTALAESVLLGLWFSWRIRKTNNELSTLIRTMLIFGCLGLAPTLAVSAYYTVAGHFSEFAYANFWSVFDRGRLSESFLQKAKFFFLATTLPLAIYGPFALIRRWEIAKISSLPDFNLLIGWLLSAAFGFIMIGNYYDHYILPLLVPLFISIAPLFSRPLIGLPSAGVLIGWAILISHYPDFSYNREKREKIFQLTNAVKPYVKSNCLFIYDGPAIIYMTTQACIPTRFAYPDHLSNDVEKASIGTDPVAETRRILKSQPGAIITAEGPVIPKMNGKTLSLMRIALIHDYTPVAAVNHPDRIFYVYARKDLARNRTIRAPTPYLGY